MKIKKLILPNTFIIEPKVFYDKRGFLYRENDNNDFLEKFSQMYEMNSNTIKKMIFDAKVETRKFTLLRNYLRLKNILN